MQHLCGESIINLDIMRSLGNVVHTSFHEFQFMFRCVRETQCFLHHSVGDCSLSIGNIMPPRRSSRLMVKCELDPTLGHTTFPVEKFAKTNGAIQDMRVENLSRKPRSNDKETLPKVIEPFSLHELLQNPFARGEGLGATICNLADSFVTSFLKVSELKPWVDPQVVLSGLFAPVCETEPTKCRIIYGHLPDDLNGIYLRNGPNVAHRHRRDGIHLLDGDGMIHSVRIRNGLASFCSRFVHTSRFRQEQAVGRPLFPKLFGGIIGPVGVARVLITILRITFGLIDISHGWGVSNTNVAFFDGHVLSLSEDDMPYIIKITESGDLITLRRFEIPSKSYMCAHPKFDPVTGDMYAFSLNFPFSPSYSIFRVPADGHDASHVYVPLLDVPVPLLEVPMVHDLAITQRFVIFPTNQIVMRLGRLTKGETPLGYNGDKIGRICLLPRDGLPGETGPKPRWFESPGINCLHFLNAWEEGNDEVVLLGTQVFPIEKFHEFPFNITFGLCELRLNIRTGSVEPTALCSELELEVGVINPKYMGRTGRYAYYALRGSLFFKGVVKLDLMLEGPREECVVGKREFGEVPMVHDLAITQRFVIFPTNQIVMRLGRLSKGEMSLGYNGDKIGWICLLPRDGLPDKTAPKPLS